MKRQLLLLLLILFAMDSFSQTELVKDINATPSDMAPLNAYGNFFLKARDALFVGILDENQNKIWRSNGAAEQTGFLKNVVSGVNNVGYLGSIRNVNAGMLVFHDKLFFNGYSPQTGSELWVSDGTDAGTTLVKDINSGTDSSSPYTFFEFKGLIYFITGDRKLWKSDGTSAGTSYVETMPLVDITSIAAGQNYFYFTTMTATGAELWRSNGTTITRVTTFQSGLPGTGIYDGVQMIIINDRAYFQFGGILFTSDGTSIGTIMIEFNAYWDLGYAKLARFGNKLIYAGSDGFYITNGALLSAQFLYPLKKIVGLTEVNSLVYALGHGGDLIRTDGTASGTVLIRNVGAITYDYMLGQIQTVDDKLILPVNSSITDYSSQEVGVYDTQTGVLEQLDINPGPNGSYPKSFLSDGSKVFFIADDGVHGAALWETDGTAPGTKFFADADTGTGDAAINNPQVLSGEILFGAISSAFATPALWKTGGDEGSTSLCNSNFLNSRFLGVLNNEMYYLSNAGSTNLNPQNLYKTNGLVSGTQLISDFGTTGGYSTGAGPGIVSNGKLFYNFSTQNDPTATGSELWVTDGTTSGSHLVKDINPGIASSHGDMVVGKVSSGIDFNSKFIFAASDGSSGIELWITDGSESGTVFLKDIKPGAGSSKPNEFVNLNGSVLFSAIGTNVQQSLYRTDGTEQGTILIKDFQGQTDEKTGVRNLTEFNNAIYFVASDASHYNVLWKTDGTESGTIPVLSISSTYSIDWLNSAGGKLYFAAKDDVHGYKLWVSDGTQEGTRIVELPPGVSSSNIFRLDAVNNSCIITVDRKLIETNGSTETTSQLSDLQPTTNMTYLDGWVYYGANSTYGNELFRSKLKQRTSQSISFAAIDPKTVGDSDFTLNASSDSGLPLSFTASVPDVVNITNGTVKILKAGTVTITASQGGNDSSLPATPISQTFTVAKANQVVTFDDIPDKKFGDPDFDLVFSSDATLPVSLQLSTPDVIELIGSRVRILKSGTVTITASQTGNDNFNAAFPISRTLTVSKAGQVVTLDDIPDKKFGDADFDIISSSDAGLPVLLQLSASDVVELTGKKIKILRSGVVSITASQTGNENIEAAAPVTRVITINKANQVISFLSIPTKVLGDGAFSLDATASSGLAVTYSTPSDKVTISGNQIKLVKAGKATIVADQSGNINYTAAAGIVREFCVNPAKPTISLNLSNPGQPTLTSSSDDNNFWFKDDVPLGNTTKVISVSNEGSYKVKVVVDGCESVFSDQQTILITGVDNTGSFQIYPVPTANTINLILPEYTGAATVSIHGMQGNIILKEMITSREKQIDLSALASGMYLVKVGIGENVRVAKIIKQ